MINARSRYCGFTVLLGAGCSGLVASRLLDVPVPPPVFDFSDRSVSSLLPGDCVFICSSEPEVPVLAPVLALAFESGATVPWGAGGLSVDLGIGGKSWQGEKREGGSERQGSHRH